MNKKQNTGGYKTERSPPSSSFNNDTNPDGGIGYCPDCCMNHAWDQCVRNEKSERHLQNMLRFRGSPHPKATTEAIEAVTAAYGKVGVDIGTVPQLLRNNSRNKYVTKAIRVSKAGQRDIVLTGRIGGVKKAEFFVDTGSQLSIVSDAFYENHKAALGPLGPIPTYDLYVADNKKADIIGSLRMATTFSDPSHKLLFTREIEYVVMVGLAEPVLAGLDLITMFFTNISVQDGRLMFRADLAPDVDARHPPKIDAMSPIRVTNTTTIKGRTTRMVQVAYDKMLTTVSDCPVLCQPQLVYNKYGTPSSIEFPAHIQNHSGGSTKPGHYKLMVMNHSHQSLTLSPGTVIGRARVLSMDPSEQMFMPYQAQSRIRTSKDPTSYVRVMKMHKYVPKSTLTITADVADLPLAEENADYMGTGESDSDEDIPPLQSAASTASQDSSAAASSANLRM